MNKNDTVKCFNNHLGVWLAQGEWITFLSEQIRLGNANEQTPRTLSTDTIVNTTADGKTAVVVISGLMMKGTSKFESGTSTVEVRRAVRNAVADKDVDSILLLIDSPGGHCSGTDELAHEVFLANKKKPVYAQVEDLCASASYWVASQTSKIFANKMAEIGSIGTVAVVTDTSEANERAGIKVNVVSTGDFKGAFAGGTKITEAQLENLQTRINEINDHFLNAVEKGRAMSKKDLSSIADGRTFMASEAVKLGLIDGVQSVEDTITMIRKDIKQKNNLGRAGSLRTRLNSMQGSEQPTVG